jgi:hypothetical protein
MRKIDRLIAEESQELQFVKNNANDQGLELDLDLDLELGVYADADMDVDR